MLNDDDTDGRLPKMSMEKMFHLIMGELVGTRQELKEDMADMKRELKNEMAHMKRDLTADIRKVDTKVDALSLKVDTNFLMFMHNHDALEQRVTVLEAKVA